ncbi:MAG: hypothetical protein CMJ58_28675 [Planctomycetaceae bacterium]|nr:hypothetical protein [Planctomycetaceae bacterium]
MTKTASIAACLLVALLATVGQAQRRESEQRLLDQQSLSKNQSDSIARLNAMLIAEYVKRADALAAKLESLADEAGRIERATLVLLDSDRGKRLATRDEAVRAFVNFDESPVVTASDVETHRARVEPLRQGIAAYAPLPRIFNPAKAPECAQLGDEEAWADAAYRDLKERQALITALVRLAPQNLATNSLPTLRDRITELKSTMIQEEVAAVDAAREESRAAGIEEKAEAASIRELEKAKLDAANELRLLRLELEKARAEFALIEAKRRAVIQEIETSVDNKNLETRLEDPKVLKKLRPFMAKGYWQPGNTSRADSLKKGPMSFSALEQFGALNGGHEGLARLLAVANGTGMGNLNNQRVRYNIPVTYTGTYMFRKHIDTDRPKWSYPKDFHNLSAEQLIEVQEVQDLLIELGPTMVKKGMLAP